MFSINPGLAQVEVGESAISLVEGDIGRLSYRGVAIEELVEWSFVKVVYLVLTGDISSARTLAEFENALFQARTLTLAEVELALHLSAMAHVHPMQVLQSMTPTLDTSTAEHTFPMFDTDVACGLVIAAKIPNLIALLRNLRTKQWSGNSPTLMQHVSKDYGTNNLNAIFLHHLKSSNTEQELQIGHLNAFSATQILQVEHSFNASTFAARVVASTLSPVSNVLAAAFGTLHGRLHGGADQAALQTALKVGKPECAAAFVDKCLENGDKVMGMGHREYKVVDPRAIFLKDCARTLSRGTEHQNSFETLEAIEARFTERMLEKGKALHANLEFYKGIVYSVLGLSPDYFTTGFSMARVYGYLAHFQESRVNNVLIRPGVKYVGKQILKVPC